MDGVYLDTCVWCRPFDKLDNKEILEEFNAVVKIIQKAMDGEIEVIGSSAVFVEVSLIEPINADEQDFCPRTETFEEYKRTG